jgi:phosphate transport system substrate-binding protein
MCNYDANLPAASHCEICNQPLKRDRLSPLRVSKIGLGLLAGLLLLTGGIYFLSKNRLAPSPTTSKLSSPVVPTPVPKSPLAVSSPIATDIQYFNSMSEVQNVPDGLFNYGGAIVFAALTSGGMNDAIAQAHPQFRLRYVEPLNGMPGSSAGTAMLINGELSFAQTSLPLKDTDYEKAEKRGLTLEQIPVAIDGVVFFTNPQLPVKGLAIDQLQAIYTGKVTNWNQLGGPNLPIVAIALDPKVTSTIKILLSGLANQKLGSSVKISRDYTSSIRQVAATPGSISYASAASVITQKTIRSLPIAKAKSNRYVKPFIDAQINTQAFRDGSYPLTRQLFVVVSHKGRPEYQAGIAYTNLLLSKEGQKIIERAGFVPLR